MLAAWRVPALAFEAAPAAQLLLALAAGEPSPDVSLGDDLRFWIGATRLALELAHRQRLVPTLQPEGGGYAARWRPLLDEEGDRRRFDALAGAMPPACRALAWTPAGAATAAAALPAPPAEAAPPGTTPPTIAAAAAAPPGRRRLLQEYLTAVADGVARSAGAARAAARGRRSTRAAGGRSVAEAWWDALFGSPVVDGTPAALRALHDQLRTWAQRGGTAGADTAGDTFRVCFRLEPPPETAELVARAAGAAGPPAHARRPASLARSAPWALRYLLQATDDPSLLVPAGEVWRQRGATARFLSRRLDQPHERLLAGLGRAARLFPPIEASLRAARPDGCALDVADAHRFVREAALLLRAGGFGVLVPGLDAKLRLRVRLGSAAADPARGSGPAAFSWDSLVAYDWQVALGDEVLTREEFEHLARLKEPLVQVRGQWVELNPEQLDHALAFFERREDGELALRDALRLALAPEGESERAGLPIAEVQTQGWIDDLLRRLRGRGTGTAGQPPEAREVVDEPPGFVGQLRPYQKAGVAWLATLHRYGLGACLADDMGLGKTIQLIALVLHAQRGWQADETQAAAARANGKARAPRRRSGRGGAEDEGHGTNDEELALSAAKGRTTHDDRQTAVDEGAAGAPGEGAAVAPAAAAPAVLLVCPTSVVGNWQHELARFAPSLRVLVHHGAGRAREQLAAEAARHDVVISTYALLHRDEAELLGVDWSAVVLDEAQNVKNAATKAAQTARKLRARWRAALTGTPVENRLSELWSIFQFLNPGYLGAADDFRKRFGNPIERANDAGATARLKALVAPFILRRVKTDRAIIQDLPEKNEMKVFCPLTREQATLYEAVVRDQMRQIEEAEGVQRRGQILATLTKLKQVCDHPALFLHDGSALPGRSGKLARLGEMLDEALAVDDRALVFTQYAEMGRLLKRHLEAQFGQEALFLHGGTPAAERDRMVARFQREGRGPRLFVLSIKAGGTGLNLTNANHVFHFDRWWNPAVENQATDRAFRIGQRRDVQVHKFVCAGTFEETIDQLIERKAALSQAIVGAGETWITELSTAELRDLFALRREAAVGAGDLMAAG